MDTAVIAKVQSFGFDVYMRKTTDSWLIFTDGKNVGYLQDGGFGFTLTTVHAPNSTSGTGYQIERDVPAFDKAMLERCFLLAPLWAATRDIQSVRKYRDIEAYRASSSFCSEYGLVPVAA